MSFGLIYRKHRITMAGIKISVSQLLICFIFAVTGINGKPPSTIVGGNQARDNEFPYMVALVVYDDVTICGGAIIDPTHILTAAHCVDFQGTNQAENLVVVSGTNNINRRGNVHRVKFIKMHPQYAPTDTWKNDIAILTLDSPINLEGREKAVKLPSKDTKSNVMAIASGWGDLSYPDGDAPEELQKLDMTVISDNKDCKFGAILIKDGQICAHSKPGTGLCFADSGGPLVSNGVVIGVASFASRCAKGVPDVFTRVYKYVDWIEKETRN